MKPTIVVAIPCYNEAPTIAKVVNDFRKYLPEAEVHVFDNNSTDSSPAIAEEAGAIIHYEEKQGKGFVMRRIFNQIQADAIVVVDGDDTYSAEDAPKLLAPILKGEADMVVGNRLPGAGDHSMVRLHRFGNWLIMRIVNSMFRSDYHDILSGYRVFSESFVRTVPLLSEGFEIESELTIKALEEEMIVVELPTSYRSRPEGSYSKLSTFKDGYRILLAATILLRDHRPLRFFGAVSLVFGMVAMAASVLRILGYLGLSALPDTLVTGMILLTAPIAVMSFGIGMILNTINTHFRELKQIMKRNRDFNDNDK